MSSKQLLALVSGTVVLAAVVLAIAFASRSNTALSSKCGPAGHAYVVTITNGILDKPQITARRCDTLTIRNHDGMVREIGFGPHEQHQAYDGVSEEILRRDQSLAVTLVATGTFQYHDHFHDEVAGSFTVTN